MPQDKSITRTIGFGYPGLSFRHHSGDSYMEYIWWMLLREKDKDIVLHINRATYASKYENDTVDFAIKYIYGIDASYHKKPIFYYGRDSQSQNDSKDIGASIGIGVEIINPQRDGFIIDVFMGQRLSYLFNEESIRTSPIFRISLSFNY